MFNTNLILALLGGISCMIQLSAQDIESLYDGPYVFTNNDSLHLRWVEAGEAHDTSFLKVDAFVFQRDSLPTVDLRQLSLPPKPETEYEDNGKVVALSDVHGQFEIMRELLRAHGIIDQKNNWSYGDGHLVVVGDNMDRGDKVTEILWFLFFLQKQAAAAGGQLHVTIGNHEAMVLTGDLRYLNRKYILVSALFTEPYQRFFRTGSVLGDWLRQQNVVLKIGKTVFVHGGVSPAMQELGLNPTQVNRTFRRKIFATDELPSLGNQRIDFLLGGEGPLWYRGYFGEAPLGAEEFSKTLSHWKADRFVIGHTSQPHIESLYGGKLLVIDCSIKLGKSGQLLKLFPSGVKVGNLDGSETSLDLGQGNVEPRRTLFDYLYRAESPKIRIASDCRSLIKKKDDEVYQPAHFNFTFDQTGIEGLALDGRVRARGNMRKKVCYFPPLKLDLKKRDLDSLGYLKLDKLKIVLPCRPGKRSQQLLFKERLTYELYEAIDTNHILTRLIDFEIYDEKKELFSGQALLVEDEEHYRQRKQAELVEKGGVALSILERTSWTRMRFFQYMIANTDWSIFNRHNVEIVKMPNGMVFAIPYDFDYCGFVGQPYAVPHESLPIESVQDRYFKRGPITETEFDTTLAHYLSIEEKMLATCQRATYLDKRSIGEAEAFVESFYRVLRRPREMRFQALNFQSN